MKNTGNVKWMILSIFITSIAISGCSNNDNDTSSGGATSPVGFNALLFSTFTDPRCDNCHSFDTGNVVAQRHESRPDDCQQCHSNVPTWRAPFRSFAFSGVTSSEICVGIKNKTANDENLLRDHLVNDELILWAVADGRLPGPDRTPAPPGSTGAWVALVDTWLNNGAICD